MLTLKQRIFDALIGLGICLLVMPIAAVMTLALTPLWSWFEQSTGIESLGHSGPAIWCFLFIYSLMLTISAWIWHLVRRTKPVV